MKRVFFLSFIIVLNLGCHEAEENLYVSSSNTMNDDQNEENHFLSIEEALNRVLTLRKKKKTALITIHIDQGDYRLGAPLKITSDHGPIRIIGEGQNKTTIKGSIQMNLVWEKQNENIWVTKINRTDRFDQMFVNGQKQILARYPNYTESGGHWQGHASDAISDERVASWEKPKGTIVHAMHTGEWGGFHYVVEGVDNNNQLILTGGQQNNRPSKMHETYRMVENVKEELDSPGEWFLDENDNLFYWPKKPDELADAIVEGVQQKHLVEMIGTEENPVRDISIEGIKFDHSKMTFLEEYEPLLRSDWCIYRGGAIFLEGTENISIKDCEFTNLGGNVIFVSKYNRKVRIADNHIHDCGASGISFVGDPGAVRSPSFQYGDFVPLHKMDTVSGPLTNSYPSEVLVDGNLIHRIGRVEKQTAGIQISMSMDITVSNNSIYDVPRSGTNVSEGTWGGHVIEYNDVFNTVLETSDHGAFNSWGRDRFWHPNRRILDEMTTKNPEMPLWDAIHTTVIRNNRFRCDHGWDIDLDDGSSNYHIYNNVCLNGGIKLREGFYRKVENNIMINNSFHPHVWFQNSGDIFKRNIVLTEYKDIRLDGWGEEVDYNFFPNKAALMNSQDNGNDRNSIYGNPGFINAKEGNFALRDNSPAYAIGFVNFPMDKFGVKKMTLKKIAKNPEIPVIWSITENQNDESQTINL